MDYPQFIAPRNSFQSEDMSVGTRDNDCCVGPPGAETVREPEETPVFSQGRLEKMTRVLLTHNDGDKVIVCKRLPGGAFLSGATRHSGGASGRNILSQLRVS